MKSTSHRDQRRGISLIETATAIVITSVILGIAVTLFYALLVGRAGQRDVVARQMERARLAEQYRRDAHAAERAETAVADRDADEPLLRLTLPEGGTIDYTLDGNRLVRLEREEDRVVRRESYRLERAADVRCELLPEGARTLARLAWNESASKAENTTTPSPALAHELLALVGRDVVVLNAVQSAAGAEETMP